MTLTKPCKVCGKPITYYPAIAERKKYCSRACAHKALRTIPIAVCEFCGQAFQPQEREVKHCSWACRRNNSIQGRHERAVKSFWSKVDKSGECWVWTASKTNGYGQFLADGKRTIAHRFSYELHYGPIPDGLFICHHCDNRRCVRPDHLFLGTNRDNNLDMIAKERHGNAVLTNEQVRAIHREYRHGNGVELAAKYGVSSAVIYYTVKKRRLAAKGK